MKFASFTLNLLFFSFQALAQDPTPFDFCIEEISLNLENKVNGLSERYREIDGPNAAILPEHRPFFLKGKPGGGAVLLLHGILSSPAPMRLLAEEFNKTGLSVLVPLVRGFGSTVKVANQSSLGVWRATVDEYYQLISKCFPDIALVGFSMGGGLAIDFILNRYRDFLLKGPAAQLSSLVLLSPAIRPSEKGARFKAWVTQNILMMDEVPFWLISKLKNDPDIRDMMKEPTKYNQYFPVEVGKSLIDLADALEASPQRFDLHPLPVSLDYSRADTATDWRWTREYLTDRFFNVKIFSYAENKNVPHTLGLSTGNETGDEIRKGVARFVSKQHNDFLIDWAKKVSGEEAANQHSATQAINTGN